MSDTQSGTMLPYNYQESASGITRSGLYKYPNPFCDIASEYVPRDLNTIFEWCEYLFLTMGTYRAAAQRVVRYFLTDIVLEGETDDEQEKYEDFLNNRLHIMQELAEIGDDYMVYGQCFISLYFPFDRFLICPKCGMQYHFDTIEYRFDKSTGDFECDCKKCGNVKVKMLREDRRSPDRSRVRIIRWSPKDIRLRFHPISGELEYYLRLDPKFVNKLLDGNHFYLRSTPWSMVKACLESDHEKAQYLYLFGPKAIYHMHAETLAGLPIKGWAIPPIMPNFKLAYYIQLLRRYDEAIALDFIVPFRILYPEQSGPQGQDPLSTMSMSNFVSHMNRMVESKRRHITDIQVAPFKIGYELLGGEAQSLSPKDNIALAIDEMLNAIGFPAELYKGSLSIQAFPVALRLFEKSWGNLVDGFNDLLSWLLEKMAHHFMWGEVKGSLRSVTLADDIERKALALQAAAGMDVSKQTAYRPLGIDYLEEQRRVVDEQEAIQQLQQEAMERQEVQQGEGGGGGAGGGGMAPGGEAGATPGDVYEQGKQMAEQLLLQTPDTARRGELIKIKHSNPTLHAIVIQEMDQMRNDMASQGQQMIMDQAKTAESEAAWEKARNTPSPYALGLLISDQLLDYNRGDLRKMAMDIKHNVKYADKAFHWIYERIRGWK